MEKTVTLEEALKRIEELEKENAELREELEYYRNRKLSGRQKHNAKWMAIYNDFVVGYESGMTMVEIAKRNNVSERTIYRYKAYYDKMKKKEEQTILLTSAICNMRVADNFFDRKMDGGILWQKIKRKKQMLQ